MDIECPHCHMAYNLDDIVHTLTNGHFKCPVCGKKIPSPLAEHQAGTPPATAGKYLVPVFILLGIVGAFAAFHFLTSADKAPPAETAVAPPMMSSSSSPPSPAQATAAPPTSPALPPPPAPSRPEATLPALPPQAQDKMQIVARIAAEFQRNHSYTLEGDFVCLDMAIDVWNQLVSKGIEAKIMGGNIQENITARHHLECSPRAGRSLRAGPDGRNRPAGTEGTDHHDHSHHRAAPARARPRH